MFISYSHDSLEHKKWTLELAIRLRNNGIDAIIDQFELAKHKKTARIKELSILRTIGSQKAWRRGLKSSKQGGRKKRRKTRRKRRKSRKKIRKKKTRRKHY